MNLQTYLALKAVTDGDIGSLLFYQAISDIDPPNGSIKTVGPSDIVLIEDAKNAPIINLELDFGPLQSGSGTPSPENIRNISGRSSVMVFHGSSQLSYNETDIAFPSAAGVVYGGTLAIHEDGSGTLTVDRGLFTVTTAKINASPNTGYHAPTNSAWIRNLNYNQGVSQIKYGDTNPLGLCPCNFAEKAVLNNLDISSSQFRTSFTGPWTTFAEFKAVIAELEENGITPSYVARLNSPKTYDISSEAITLFDGSNAIWIDSGKTKITYYAVK